MFACLYEAQWLMHLIDDTEKLPIQVFPENKHEMIMLKTVLAFMGRVLQNRRLMS